MRASRQFSSSGQKITLSAFLRTSTTMTITPSWKSEGLKIIRCSLPSHAYAGLGTCTRITEECLAIRCVLFRTSMLAAERSAAVARVAVGKLLIAGSGWRTWAERDCNHRPMIAEHSSCRLLFARLCKQPWHTPSLNMSRARLQPSSTDVRVRAYYDYGMNNVDV